MGHIFKHFLAAQQALPNTHSHDDLRQLVKDLAAATGCNGDHPQMAWEDLGFELMRLPDVTLTLWGRFLIDASTRWTEIQLTMDAMAWQRNVLHPANIERTLS